MNNIDEERHYKLNQMLVNLSEFDYDMVYALVERLSEDSQNLDEAQEVEEVEDKLDDQYGQDYIDSLDEKSFTDMLGEDYLERLMHWRND